MLSKQFIVTLLLFLFLTSASQVQGAVIPLTNPGDQTTINGVIFFVPSVNVGNIASGSGNFLRLDDSAGDGIQAGFNTTVTPTSEPTLTGPTPDGVKDQGFSGALLLSDIPQLTIGSVTYYELALSIQQQGGGNGTINLNELKIGSSTTDAISNFNTQILSTDIIEAGTTDTILLTNVYPGTNLDLLVYVPTTLLTSDPNVVLYSSFHNADDGPDEWAVNAGGSPLGNPSGNGGTAIPEPSSFFLAGLVGAFGVVMVRYRRRKTAVTRGAAAKNG